jgi:hypothetical protein
MINAASRDKRIKALRAIKFYLFYPAAQRLYRPKGGVVGGCLTPEGAPFNEWTFPEFKDTVRGLLDMYLNNASLNWANTLGQGAGYPDRLGDTDLFAAFCFYLMEHYGGKTWVENVWKYAGQRPHAATTQDAVDNFIIAASQAAGTNLAELFQSWRWPVSEAVTALRFNN